MSPTEILRSLRALARAPAFSLLGMGLIALAFGAFACVASVVYGLLLKPLPFPQADRLVSVQARIFGIPHNVGLSTPLREEIAAHAHGVESIAAYRSKLVVLRDESGHRIGTLNVALVEPRLLGMLGAQPALGRLFAAEDVADGAARSVMLSWQEWQTRYGGATDAIGRTLRLDDADYRVIGVLPQGFALPTGSTNLWLPLAFDAQQRSRQFSVRFDGTLAIARLRADTTPDAATEEVTTLAKSMPELTAAFGDQLKLQMQPLRSLWIGERRGALLLMLLAVSMVWLVTAANVANLFLARGLERRQHSALAAALGATPWQRARTVIIEAVLLCLGGIALGCALLPAGLALLRHFDLLPTSTPQAIGIDAPTLALLALLAFALCAALAAVGVSAQRDNLNDMIRYGGAQQTPGGAAQAARRSLVVAQVALTVALLFGIGVLLRSSHNLLAEDIGFRRDHLLYASLADVVPADATAELRGARLTELAARVRALPGVTAAGIGSMVPFGNSIAAAHYTPPGLGDHDGNLVAHDQRVDAGYFAALGIPLLRGRAFDDAEVRSNAPLAIVDELFVKRHLGATDPLGQHFRISAEPTEPDREVTIIGVVPTLKQRALDEVADRPAIYQPTTAPPYAILAVRTSVDPTALIAPLEALGWQIAPMDGIGPIATLDERIADTLQERTRLNSLLGLLALTALLLATVGLYAVLAYAVRQRVPEFGVRMALGANASKVLRQVLGQGCVLVGLGVALGLPLAWVFARLLSARLYQVGTFDLPTLAGVALLLAMVGLFACLWPARRAAATDPAVALRNE